MKYAFIVLWLIALVLPACASAAAPMPTTTAMPTPMGVAPLRSCGRSPFAPFVVQFQTNGSHHRAPADRFAAPGAAEMRAVSIEAI